MPWSQVSSLRYLAWAQALVIKNQQNESIWIYPYMSGFEKFWLDVQEIFKILLLGG